MEKALFIEGNRNGYGPDQCAGRTATVDELIEALEAMREEIGGDAKVFLRNDGGYTYGSISYHDMSLGCYDSHGTYLEGSEEFEGFYC